MDFELRPLQAVDAERLAHLAAAEGWADNPRMFLDYLRWSPCGCYVAARDDEVIGGVTTIAFGAVGWVGNLLVDRAHRGRGVGSALLHEAADALERSGATTLYLESVPEAQRLYLRAGFAPRQEVLKMERRASGAIGTGSADAASEGAAGARPGDAGATLPAADVYAAIAATDREGWGVDRGAVLAGMYRDRHVLLARRGAGRGGARNPSRAACAGFIMLDLEPETASLGPWGVSRHVDRPDDDAAEALLTALMVAFPQRPMVVESPAASAGPRLLERWGFRAARTNLIMSRGPGGGDDFSLVLALAGAGDMG